MTAAVQALARPCIRRLTPYSSARSTCEQAPTLLDANESPFAPFPGDPSMQGLNRYPEPQPKSLRLKLAELYGVESSQLFLGRGADDAIDALVRVFCEPGTDGVLTCPPTYGVYEVAAAIQGARRTAVPYRRQRLGFELDLQGILAQPEKLIFLCSPNNPTGHCLPHAQLTELCDALARCSVVVLDEAYVEFAKASSAAALVCQHPNLVVLRTLSKAWALAGARCGVAIAQTPITDLMHKVRAPYPLCTPAIRLVERALTAEGHAVCRERIATTLAERARLAAALSHAAAVTFVFASEANFLLIETKDAAAVIRACGQKGVIVRDRSTQYGLEGCIRVSVGTAAENDRLLEAIGEVE